MGGCQWWRPGTAEAIAKKVRLALAIELAGGRRLVLPQPFSALQVHCRGKPILLPSIFGLRGTLGIERWVSDLSIASITLESSRC